MKKVAVVSGVSSSLGAAISARLTKEGYTVAGLSRSSVTYPCDIRLTDDCETQIKKVFESLGAVSVLVNCAGVNTDKLLVRTTADDFASVYATNVIGAMNLTRACLRHGGMLKAKGGSIVNIGSVVGLYGNAGQTAYAASKAALIGASLSIAKEYSPANIRCNVLCPGLVSGTKMWESLNDHQRQRIVEESLLKRCATVEEIADAAFFLAHNSYVNGHTLVLDGGR